MANTSENLCSDKYVNNIGVSSPLADRCSNVCCNCNCLNRTNCCMLYKHTPITKSSIVGKRIIMTTCPNGNYLTKVRSFCCRQKKVFQHLFVFVVFSTSLLVVRHKKMHQRLWWYQWFICSVHFQSIGNTILLFFYYDFVALLLLNFCKLKILPDY